MSSKESTVLIVGAGPAGLVLALDLLQHGLKVRIIEKTESIFIGQRGAAIMPRSLELYRTLGVLPEIEKLSVPPPRIKTCEIGQGDSKIIEVSDMFTYVKPTSDRPYYNPVFLGQGRVQHILASHLKKHGCEVETGTQLESFEQYDDHVVYQLKKTAADGTTVEEEAKASYVVGADGTRGVVRKLLGLSFLGETRGGEHWVIADVRVKGINIDANFWHMWGDFNQGFLAIRPTERRGEGEFWIAIAGHKIDPETLSTNQVEFTKLVRELSGLQSLEITQFMTLNHYKINIRMVNQFGKGRVFVAGDAAHTHSFTGGQGMNSSIQDSFNLGWKLSLVSKSLSSPILLDSYTSERLPVIADVLGKTTELLNITVTRAAVKDAGKSWMRKTETYQLNVHYRGSSIVFDELDAEEKEGLTRVIAGDRAPDAPGILSVTKGLDATQLFHLFGPTRHIALVFPHVESDIAPFVSALVKYPKNTVDIVIVLPKGSTLTDKISQWDVGSVVLDNKEYAWKTYPTAEGAKVVVVRPDGYVGVIAKSVEGLERYRRIIFDTAV